MRSVFHFGAPYNGELGFTDQRLLNCVLDGRTPEAYVALVKRFGQEFAGVDDLWLYTYDQNAWLCNEFGPCPNCRGIPLHERAAPFVNALAHAWRECNPQGRLWWEPWELSGGQVLHSLPRLDAEVVGLALHSNIAEVMVALPVDRFVKNAGRLAKQCGIPVVLEGFFGAATEEVEPFRHLAWPLTTVRQLRAMAGVEGVMGLKEYYGLLPDRPDPNLGVSALFFERPEISDDEALSALSAPLKEIGGEQLAGDIERFWRKCSEGTELFPWEASWFIRKIGLSRPTHALSAARVRGQQCHTPSWDSSRRAIFMKTDDSEPDPWMLEEVQLRCELASARWQEAHSLAQKVLAHPNLLPALQENLSANLSELGALLRRTNAYAFHCRETNLAAMLRDESNTSNRAALRAELLDVLGRDAQNWRAEGADASPLDDAIALFQRDEGAFLETYFTKSEVVNWSEEAGLTSR